MIILIAESKTMLPEQKSFPPEVLKSCTPCGDVAAGEIMEAVNGMSVGELAEQTGLTATLAARMKKMAYEFAYKATGNRAIEAFTGVVFKALDYPSLTPEAQSRCDSEVGIISSLYGWLRPSDIVKPYRLDFTSHLDGIPVEGRALYSFWRPDVTKQLVRKVMAAGETEILNLLPSDAAKCIDWKLVKRFAKVWKVDFQEVQDGGRMKTPAAGRLKTLRGLLLRQILEEGLRGAASLKNSVSPNYVCEGTPVYPDHLRFLC